MRQVQMGNALKNDEWIDIEDVEIDSITELPGLHVLVTPVSVKCTTKGGMLIPYSTTDNTSHGTTVAEVTD